MPQPCASLEQSAPGGSRNSALSTEENTHMPKGERAAAPCCLQLGCHEDLWALGTEKQGSVLNRGRFLCSTGLSHTCGRPHSCSCVLPVALLRLNSSCHSTHRLGMKIQQRRRKTPWAVETHWLLHRKHVFSKSQIFPAYSS